MLLKNILLFLFGFLLCFCAPQKYVVGKPPEISRIDLDHSIYNFIPFTEAEILQSKILDYSTFLLWNRQHHKAKQYLHNLEKKGTKTSDLYLSKTLLFMAKKNYISAYEYLKKINALDYPLQKRLITIDLNYEISKMKGNYDFQKYLTDYQELIDAFPNNVPLKKMVAVRVRFLRYNY